MAVFLHIGNIGSIVHSKHVNRAQKEFFCVFKQHLLATARSHFAHGITLTVAGVVGVLRLGRTIASP